SPSRNSRSTQPPSRRRAAASWAWNPIARKRRRALKHARPAFVIDAWASSRQKSASDFSYSSRSAGTTTGQVSVLLQHLPAGVSSFAIVRPSGGHVKSLLDPTFKYVPSVETDIRKTFARVRR